MSNPIKRLLPLLLLGQILSGSASAQQNNRTPNLNLGDAVVTGFSGTLAPAASKAANKSVVDHTFINPDGPSARIIGIAKPGYVWDGRLFPAPKSFDVMAKDVGQVFGIALDDATPPNIYLSATSAFGLNIVSRGRDGATERRKKGGPGAGWMKGQFGLDLQGGPGAIYKVDGRTGVTSLFANVTLDGVPNPGPGLGNLAYDSAHKQLFVSDLYTGLIHRFDLEGKELGRYDHGVTTLAAAKQTPVAFNPANRPNIASDRFDSEKPDTWGFAPAARRVFALAVNDGRLYYSVLAGSKIWSVGIERDGNFSGDARLELDVPLQPGVYPVTDIAFAHSGTMILTERAPITATYDYSAFTRPAEPRVLRFTLKAPNDLPSPGRWKPLAEEYAVGLAGEYRNTNGGVALGYGYGKDGVLNTGACEAALWTTGQNLRNNTALRSQLEPGGPLVVHGLQGSPADLIRNANTPPTTSYFIDYIDRSNDPRASGHTGSVRIYAKPCAPSAHVQPVTAVVPIAIPGGHGGVCTPTCVCPPGTVLDGKECVKRDCPTPQHMNQRGACVCPNGNLPVDGKCAPVLKFQAPVDCTSPMIPNDNGTACVCPPGSQEIGGNCVPQTISCVPPMIPGSTPNSCVCQQGTVLVDGKCVPQVCPAPLVPGPCECPSGSRKNGNECLQETPIDLGIQKTGGTTPVQEPYYDFTISVTNVGNAISNTNVITVTDTVPPNMTYDPPTGTGWTCVPPGGPAGTVIVCTYGPAVTAGQVLPPISINATATGSAPYPPVTNCAVVSVPGSSGLTDSNASNNQACVTVTKPGGGSGSLILKKVVVNHSPLALPAMTFPVTVTCDGTATNLSFSSDGTPQTVNVNSTPASCTVQEGAITTPPNACPPNLQPAWTTTYTPSSPVSVTGPGATMTIQNVLDCERGGNLVVTKVIDNRTTADLTGISFPAVVTCNTDTFNVSLSASAPNVLHNKVIGSVCSVVETLPAAPATGCPQGSVPTWMTPPTYTPATTTVLSGSGAALNVLNVLSCVQQEGLPKTPIACKLPQVMIPGVGCACPNGGTLVDGACVPKIVCKPPLVPSANGKDCGCPKGEVLRRGKCVDIETPKQKREKEKACKQGEVRKNGECVKKHETGITGRDVIRVLPGLIPGIGGRSGGGGQGGGAVRGR